MSSRPDRHMRQSDAFAWYMERDPLLRSTVVAVIVLDRAPDPARVHARLDRASRVVPGMRDRLVEVPFRLAPPRWTVDPDFDLSWHVRRIVAAEPRSLTGVLDLARTEGMAAFDPARPLWTWTTVEGLAGGRAAVILKVHHSLTDGIGGMQMLAELVDLSAGAPEPRDLPPEPEPEHLGAAALIVDALGYQGARAMQAVGRAVRSAPGVAVGALRRPVATAREAFVTAGSLLRMVRPVTDTKSPVMRARRLGWHYGVFDVDLDAMKNAAKASQGTLNDVFLAGIVAGLRRYHEHHGAEPAELRVTMPISIREPGDPPGGNRITLMRFGVPVAQKDPATEIAVLHARAAASRQERAVAYTNTVAEVLNLLPRGFVGGMLKHIDFLASNVPGLDTAVFVGGARVDEFYAFGPTIGAALNVTLLSYCSTCFLGVNTDTGAIPDPDSLVDCLRAGFAEVVKVGVGASGEPGA